MGSDYQQRECEDKVPILTDTLKPVCLIFDGEKCCVENNKLAGGNL